MKCTHTSLSVFLCANGRISAKSTQSPNAKHPLLADWPAIQPASKLIGITTEPKLVFPARGAIAKASYRDGWRCPFYRSYATPLLFYTIIMMYWCTTVLDMLLLQSLHKRYNILVNLDYLDAFWLQNRTHSTHDGILNNSTFLEIVCTFSAKQEIQRPRSELPNIDH